VGKDDQDPEDGDVGVIDREIALFQREIVELDRGSDEFLERFPAEHYPDVFSEILWTTHEGHAYSNDTVAEVRSILRLPADEWPDPEIHVRTDRLAMKVGFCAFAEPKHTAREHERLLQANIIGPATRLLQGLQNPEIEKVFLMPRSRLSYQAQKVSREMLEHLVQKAEQQQRFYAQLSERGKDPLSNLKYFYVAQVHKLCRAMDPSFRPTRSNSDGQMGFTKFTGMVDLLHTPFKWGKSETAKIAFDDVTRAFVRNWNANLNAGRDPTQHLYGAL
jgi:hypothetical protein